jgi:hypothetical protein
MIPLFQILRSKRLSKFHSFVFRSYVSSQILHVFPSIGLDLKRLATLLATPRHLLLPTGAFFPRNYLTAIGYDFSFSFLTKSPTTSIFEEKQDDIHSFQPTTVFS